jgi:putative MFS transporter
MKRHGGGSRDAGRTPSTSRPPASADSATKWLFWLLGAVVVVEGFDTNVANVVLPFVGDTFAVGAAELRNGQGLIALGAVAAYFTIQCADRFGRRPVLLVAVVAFSLLSLGTALTRALPQFIVLQFLARMALVTQLTIAYVLLSESLPAARRGRVNGMLAAFASAGAALPALLLEPLIASGHDWRGLFVLGALALLVVPALWRRVPESPAFLLRRAQAREAPSIARQLSRLLAPDLRRRFLSVSALWFVINFWVGATMFLFTLYAVRERGWTPADLQLVAPFGLACAFAGYAGAGILMDAIGRRPAAGLLLVAGGLATVVTFRAQSFAVVAAGWVCLQALQGIWPIAYTLTTELFPTELRASANGLAHNLLGRWGQVAGPLSVNLVAVALGTTGAAVAALGCVTLLALPLLRWGLPETRATELGAADAGDISSCSGG